jgi:hypothetical protein
VVFDVCGGVVVDVKKGKREEGWKVNEYLDLVV